MMRTRHTSLLALAGSLLASAPLHAGHLNSLSVYQANLQTLNSAYGSTATGTATVTLDTRSVAANGMSGVATLRVQIQASGLQNLSGIPGAVHLGHIHGQFVGNAARPLLQQGDGTFFDGEGGVAVDSFVPTAADDGARNIAENPPFLDFFEGRPDYGPIVLNLASTQIPHAPDGVPPGEFIVDLIRSGQANPTSLFPSGSTFNLDTIYSFDLANQDARRQFNNLNPLDFRVIVLHGLTVPRSVSDPIDAVASAVLPPGDPRFGVPLAGADNTLGTADDQAFRLTAPVAAGELTLVSSTVIPEPSSFALIGLAAAALLARRR